MAQLIDDMLNLSRVSRGEMRHEEIYLSQMARDSTEQLQRGQPTRVVEVKIADGIKARGDNGLLRIALENLLGNAWKFTSKQASSKIEFGAQAGDNTLDMLRATFESRGFHATLCRSAQETLQIARTAEFDVIISDIGLPEIDGYELIKQLRRVPHLRDTPALALTGYASQQDRALCPQASTRTSPSPSIRLCFWRR
jgi:hypothetical protein